MEPNILTENTYYWRPGCSASQRRQNEKRRIEEVKDFLNSLGFSIEKEDSESVDGKKDNIEVSFSYRESCRNVYKRFQVFKDGKRSNITALRKMYNEIVCTRCGKKFDNKKMMCGNPGIFVCPDCDNIYK